MGRVAACGDLRQPQSLRGHTGWSGSPESCAGEGGWPTMVASCSLRVGQPDPDSGRESVGQAASCGAPAATTEARTRHGKRRTR